MPSTQFTNLYVSSIFGNKPNFETFATDSLYNVFMEYIVRTQFYIEQVSQMCRTSRAFRDLLKQEMGYEKCMQHQQPHCINDKPIEKNGNLYWYKDGKMHRDNDLPAKILRNGSRYWCENGKRHRDGDQPAIVTGNGTQFWYKYGSKHRDDDKPSIEYPDGEKEWYKDGYRHRDADKPAIVSGTEESWYEYGVFIRDNNQT